MQKRGKTLTYITKNKGKRIATTSWGARLNVGKRSANMRQSH